jgi:hypothetical protein
VAPFEAPADTGLIPLVPPSIHSALCVANQQK